jgi:hypothetical protein
MSHTTTLNHSGRLCNAIFVNLCVSIIAKKKNILVDYNFYDEIISLGMELFKGDKNPEYCKQLTEKNFFELLNSNFEKSIQELLNTTNTEYNLGDVRDFFQTKEISNYLYYYLREEEIQRNIMNSNPNKERYNNNNDCFIHVRLGDSIDKNPGLIYYLKALYIIPFNNLYISSDSLEHDIIKEIIAAYPKCQIIDMSPSKTIQFGSTCKYIILSHGSYSAMIGYLGYFSEIYYPSYNLNRMWHGDIFSIRGWNQIDIMKMNISKNK